MQDLNEPRDGEEIKTGIITSERDEAAYELGKVLFEWRDLTPVPFLVLLLFFAKPTAISATLGLVLISCGEALRIYSVAFIGSISRTRAAQQMGPRLIQRGPFSYIRNPLYVANFLICVGITVFGAKVWIVALMAVAFMAQYHYIVIFEEQMLRTKFGDEYEAYTRTVPRWWPRKRMDWAHLEWPESFIPAIQSEKRTLIAIGAIVAVLLLAST